MSNGVSAVSAMTSVIAAIGTCSSSATACVSDVRMFCPTSILPVKTVTSPVWRDVQPRVDVGGERLAASPRAARLLPFEARRHEQHDEAAAERLQEVAAIERKQVPRGPRCSS